MKNKSLLFISILIIVSFFLNPLIFNKFYSYRDTFLYVIPLKHFLIEQLKNGKIPWWNPYNGGGEYFLSNPQVNLFYPLSYLFFLPPHIAFQIFQALQILFCFLGVYLLSLSYKKSNLEAISFGLSIVFSGVFLSLWDLPFEMGCISFSFLSLWALKEGKFKLFILFLSLMFFSGEPFTFLFVFLFLIFFIIFEKIDFFKPLKSFFLFILFSSGIIIIAISLIGFSTRTEKESLIFEGINLKMVLSLVGGSSTYYNSGLYTYLPILFFGTFIFSKFISSIFSKGKKIYLFPFFFFLFLSMGSFGVFKFLFLFPPLSFLRYPDRFLPLCLLPMLLVSYQNEGKKTISFLIHFFLILVSFIFFFPKSLIFIVPILSLFLIIIIPKDSKFVLIVPVFDLILSLPLFSPQEFRVPKEPFDIKSNALFRVFTPKKDLIYLKYLYPYNAYTKESDFKSALILSSYTNLFYPISTSYTPHPFPLKVYKNNFEKEDFILSCEYACILESDGPKWKKLNSKPVIEPAPENFKVNGDGFEFEIYLKEEGEIVLRFLKLPFTKVFVDGRKIEIKKEKFWIIFNLEKGKHRVLVSFTPLIIKIIYIFSLLAWIIFLCYLIIRWIIL